MVRINTTQIEEVIKSEAIAFHSKKDLRDDKNFAEFYQYLQSTYEIVNDFGKQKREYNKETGELIIPTISFARYFSTNPPAAFNAFKRTFDFSILNESLTITHKPNKNKFVLAAMKLFPNLDAYSLGTSLTNIRCFIENIYANYGIEGAMNQQITMYQYSKKGGTGKGEFMNAFRTFCDKYNISNCTGNIVGRWIGSEFSKNKVALINEFFPPKGYNRDETIININNLVDNVDYKVEYKNEQPIYLKSQSSFIINSNELPFDCNDRRYGIVRYNEIAYKNIPLSFKDLYFKDTNDVEVIRELFESCPFGEYFEDAVKVNKTSYDSLIFDIRDLVFAGIADPNATPRQIAAFISANKGENDSLSKKHTFENVRNAILDMVNEGIIAPTVRINGKLEYSKYNMEEIADLYTNEDAVPNTLDSFDNEWDRTNAAFMMFLEPETTTTPPTGPKNDKGDDYFTEDDVKKFGCLVKDTTYSKPSTKINKSTQFLITATPKKDFLQSVVNGEEEIDAKGEHHLPVFFTYESDDLTLDEQYNKADKLLASSNGDSVFSITNSGHKSIHTLVYIDPKQREEIAKDFKYYWNEAAKIIYGSTEHLDSACASIARLSRLPGGIRDDGSYQKCGYMNRECKPLDLSSVIAKHKKEIEVEQVLRSFKNEMRKVFNTETDEMTKLENIHNTGNRSESFELAYDVIVNGSCPSGENYVGAIKSLKGMDFSEDFVRTNLFDVVKQQHPSNLTCSFEKYWK